MELDKIKKAVKQKQEWAAKILQDSSKTIVERAEILRDVPDYCLPINPWRMFDYDWYNCFYIERYEVFNAVRSLNEGLFISLKDDDYKAIEEIFNAGYAGFRYDW